MAEVTFYLALLGVILLLSVVVKPESAPANRKVFALTAFGLLAAVSAVRACDVGADTHQYCTYYSIIGSMGWNEASVLRYEPGFFFLNKALYLVSPDPQVLLFFSSMLIIGGIGYYVYASQANITVAVSFFVLLHGYAMSMAWMRQSIAAAVIAAFIPRLSARKPLGFIVAVAVASQFHSSAWVALVLLPLAWLRLRPRVLALIGVCSLVLWAVSRNIFSLVAERTGLFEGYLSEFATSGGKLGVLLEATLFLFCVAFMVYARGFDTEAVNVVRTPAFSHMAAWMVIPAVALAYGSNAYLRLTLYFIPILSVGLADAGTDARRSGRRIMLDVMVMLTVCYFLAISYLRPEWFRVTPYRSVVP